MANMTSDSWLTPQDVAAMVGFSEALIYREIKAGVLRATYVGAYKRWRIRYIDAHAYHVSLYGCPPTTYSAQSAPTTQPPTI
jgi:excisionase family DNA binding protein